MATLEGNNILEVHSWTRQYTVLLHSILNTAFGAKQPAYSVILSLDRRVRDFPIPAAWRPVSDTAEGPAPPVPLELHMIRWISMSRKEMSTYEKSCFCTHSTAYHVGFIALLHLHRPYFAQALKEMPSDLARHRYIPSVIAIYRSAWRLIEGLQIAWRRVPQVLTRFPLAWSQGLSAAVSRKSTS